MTHPQACGGAAKLSDMQRQGLRVWAIVWFGIQGALIQVSATSLNSHAPVRAVVEWMVAVVCELVGLWGLLRLERGGR